MCISISSCIFGLFYNKSFFPAHHSSIFTLYREIHKMFHCCCYFFAFNRLEFYWNVNMWFLHTNINLKFMLRSHFWQNFIIQRRTTMDTMFRSNFIERKKTSQNDKVLLMLAHKWKGKLNLSEDNMKQMIDKMEIKR